MRIFMVISFSFVLSSEIVDVMMRGVGTSVNTRVDLYAFVTLRQNAWAIIIPAI